jgi:lipopolysaccharide export system protein LptA
MNVDFQASSTEGAVEKAEQWGKFRYEDESKSATAGRCTYEGAKELLIMTEAPEITDRQSGKTTGGRIEYDQKQKILYVHHHVRSILSAKKGDQSLLAGSDSSSPSVVTADEMQFYSEANRAYYAGNVLLLSAEQKLQSKELEIIKGGEQMEARGEVNHLIYKTDQNNKKKSRKTKGDSSDLPINVQSSKLNYIKATNQIHYSGNVKLQSPNYDLSAASLDVKWDKEGKKINRATARENVMIVEENKIGKGDTADYYLDPERFVLIGTPAQIDSFEKSQSTMRSTAPRLIFFVNEDKTRLETK